MEFITQYQDIIILVIVGLVAGWLVGLIFGSRGLLGNLIIGILGALIGGLLVKYNVLNLALTGNALINQIIVATVGAIILVLLIRLLRR